MGIYADKILPRIVDKTCGTKDIGEWRTRAMEGLSGVIIEPGFGSGTSLPYYPDAVTKVYAIDPAELGQQLGADRLAESPIDVEFIGLDGQEIPLDDDTCDAGLLSFTLCTIPDPMAALSEMRRVIKPGGWLHFLEHGIAESESVQKWQHRIEPVQKRIGGGCHLTRDHAELIESAGFQVVWVERGYAKGPKPWTYLHLGRAINP